MSQTSNEQQAPILSVQDLKKYFPIKQSSNPFSRADGNVKAVNDISFDIKEGETFGLVGESGCGKSTTGKTILRLTDPTDGKVFYKDQNIFDLSSKEFINMKKDLQMVFQDPYSSLNPKKKVGDILEEPLIIHNMGNKEERIERVIDVLNQVGLGLDHYYRYPHEFSGGQKQRIGLARALVADPKVVVCDEPVSALDVSIQSQIINLLEDIQQKNKLSFLFITHDMSVVRHISHRIGVMYLGELVEEAYTDDLFAEPLHPYTEALLSAVPRPNTDIQKERIILKGDVPSPSNPPSGCVFHTRCPYAMEICKNIVPKKQEISSGHTVACHLFN